jgi:hypothetical protein
MPKRTRRCVVFSTYRDLTGGEHTGARIASAVAQTNVYHSSAWRGNVDRKAKADISVRVPTDEQSRFSVDLKAGRRPRPQITDGAGYPSPHIGERIAVREPPLSRQDITEAMFRGREIARPMESNRTDLLRDGESHRDIVVELGLDIGPAKMAMIAVVEFVHGAEALNYAGARRAQQHPVHLEQSDCHGVQKKVDRLRLGQALVGGELDWVDAKEGVVVAGSDNGLEPRHDPWAPLASALQCNKPFLQELLVDCLSHSRPF